MEAALTLAARSYEHPGITDPADVHFVQIKCPLLTAQRITEAETRGEAVATRDTLKSMGLSRGASALGVAVALDEIARDTLTDAVIGADTTLWSGRASASAGIELMNHEIVVLGMSANWSGPLSIDHAVMRDAIDIEPVRGAFHRLGFTATGQLAPSERLRLVAVLATAGNARHYAATTTFSIANNTASNPIRITIDSPGLASGPLSGTVSIYGWAYETKVAIRKVAVSVDGISYANASYGSSRPDVCAVYPGNTGCPNGFLDARRGWPRTGDRERLFAPVD